MSDALPSYERPSVDDVVHTADLPDTPQRLHRIPARAWVEAPEVLLRHGDDLAVPVEYKRRSGQWLLWRAGPPVGEARYLAVAPDLSHHHRFDLHGKLGEGAGPDGAHHTRFRSWKEALRDHPPGGGT